MIQNLNIDSFPFVAESFLVDKMGRMRPATLCNYMLSCGSRHAEARGFGATDSLGWVLARLFLHVERIPVMRERFKIETWVRSMYHGFTDRCVRVIDEEGKEIASLIGIFALMDLKTRTSVDLNGDIGMRLVECLVPDAPFAIDRVPSISRLAVDDVMFKMRPKYSDIDINGHMNSIRTLDHILDSFPLEYMNTHTLTDFVANYMNEGEATEELSYGVKELEPDRFLAQVTKENGIVASRSELRFVPLKK